MGCHFSLNRQSIRHKNYGENKDINLTCFIKMSSYIITRRLNDYSLNESPESVGL